ncbi:MAG TPA: hypothetical protein VNE63_17435 [Candidatus Acidoferrales bacterium]|nr:hypothetical protein [Candidatus Acidoferrales bacterium]
MADHGRGGRHCTEGIGIWQWASNDQDTEPDVVMACCGDTPTLEILAAVFILRKHLPDLNIRVINVVDLMKLQPSSTSTSTARTCRRSGTGSGRCRAVTPTRDRQT